MVAKKPKKRHVLKGGALPPSKRKFHGNRVTQQLYDAMWKAYDGGMTVKRDLAKLFGLSDQTIRRVVDEGYPSRGMVALKQRAKEKLHTEVQAEQIVRAKAALDVADEWQQAREHNLNLIRAAKGGVAKMVQAWFQQMDNVRWVRERRYKDAKGNYQTIEVGLTAADAARIGLQIAQAGDIFLKMEALQMGKPTENLNVTAPGWLTMSDDQVAHIISTGQLPPGVTDEQLFGAQAGALALPEVSKPTAEESN